MKTAKSSGIYYVFKVFILSSLLHTPVIIVQTNTKKLQEKKDAQVPN